MSDPHFRPFWGKFSFQGQDHPLSHLDQFDRVYAVSADRNVTIRVIFSHHCFTEETLPSHHPDLDFTLHRNDPRSFSFRRHALSATLPSLIGTIMGGKVQMTTGVNYVRLTTQMIGGQECDYSVFFSLDRANVAGIDLLMRVRSAHDRTDPVQTFGDVRFKNLVELALKGRRPKKIFR